MSADNVQHSVLMVGLTDAGKTNFLSKLWLALDSGTGVLLKDGLPSELQYLRDGAEHLLKGEFAPRTQHGVEDRSEIPVKAADNPDFRGTLVVPDVPGEQVMRVYRTRQWSHEWEDQIRPGTGCLLFVRVDSDDLVAPLDWISCPRLCGAPMSDAEPKKDGEGAAIPPTQVVLVDWLQFLRKAFTARAGWNYRPRVGIVVAAWDLAPADQKDAGPEAWIRANLPMLWQFVSSNDDAFEFTYFGVSVTSGDLSDDADFRKAYLDADPRTAGEVVHSLSGRLVVSADVTLPVAWALGLAQDRRP